jgi:hypothetical protein
MSSAFVILLVTLVITVGYGLASFSDPKYRRMTLIVYAGWLIVTGTLGALGVVKHQGPPPGLLLVVAPVIPLMIMIVRSNWATSLANSVPLAALLGIQIFRLPLELVLHSLWRDGRLPQEMTYSGANFDIVMGISAPMVAWLAATKRLPRPALIAWNVAGIFMVINVASRGIINAVRLDSTALEHLAISQFPYTFIPSLMVPVAIALHVLSLRRR